MLDLSKLEPIKTAQDMEDANSLGKALAYLNETNWHAFALIEEGTPIPEDIKSARSEARATIAALSPPKI